MNKQFIRQTSALFMPHVEWNVDKAIDWAERLDERLSERGYGDKPKSKGNGSRFAPPSLEEAKAYIKQKGYSIDPVAFFSHYQTNGWKVGKNPMKCWKSAVSSWEARENKDQKKDSPEWAKIPRDNDDLAPWAKKHGYPAPRHETYPQYRAKLQNAVELRLKLTDKKGE